ncbi:hypothetical protein BH11MYX4_BH11MYX4_60880 [soil metagenome]
MSDEHDPRRLLDEGGAPGELRSLLRAGRSEVPNEAQMLALAAKLGVLGGLGGLGGAGAAGAGGAGAKGAAGAGAAIKASLAMKVIGTVALIGVAGGGAALVVRHGGETVDAPVGIVASAAASPSARSSASAGASASTRELASAAPTASVVPTSATSATTTATTNRVVESPEAEVKLLERAQDALRTRPDEALALCADHVKRFPSGMLVQEREVIAVEALVKTGRKDEARARADRFKARFPGSSHTRRLEALLAN